MRNRIRDLREDADLTQKQVAQYLQMSQTGYSKYETGENDIPTVVWEHLADFYGVSVDYLMGRTDEKSLIRKAIDNDKKAENVQNVLRFSFLFA